MSIDLSLSIEKIKSVGPRNLSRLHKLGINTVKDLLWHFPVRYDDYTETFPISDISPNSKVNIQGEVIKIDSRRLFPRKMTITNAIIRDSSGAVKVVWFNQPYIENQLSEGTLVSLAGKVNLDRHGLYLSSPVYERISTLDLKHTSGLVPIYPETEGITSKYLRFLIKPLLKDMDIQDPLPEKIIMRHNLPSLTEAVNKIHYPLTRDEADIARERFAFEDIFLLQVKALLERRKMNQLKSSYIEFDQDKIKSFIDSLPFQMTGDQKIAAWEILKDLQKTYPMNRLLEGDVGSGKTVVALIAAVQAADRNFQTVFMAPTEVLASQHYQTICDLTKGLNLNNAVLTSSISKLNQELVKKSDLKKDIANGSAKIIVGTHAVIQKDVSFKNLALVVIDEQHRFGIKQRATLVKGSDLIPHLLSMTATPIPRTLALTIYGDLDISLIKEKPRNRQKIITRLVSQSRKMEAYNFIRSEIIKGCQAFVVCPRIETSEAKNNNSKTSSNKNLKQDKLNIIWQEVKAVEEEYEKLSKKIFPELKIAMLHGKMRPKDKNEIMDKFKKKEIDILVSTSVIEVGVDVPNATIIIIESPERFGLAQLHQFRGRVGRAEHQSYCFLFPSTSERNINQRLRALVKCDDGFELAEKDMAIRGPGEFFGTKQSGLPDLAMASLTDMELIKKARLEARLLLKDSPSLSNYPLLKNRLDELRKITHFE